MSKSIGNVVAPDEVISKYGVEALRFYLSHEIPVGNDGDFSWKRFGELYDSKLRNQLGNLLNRVLVLLKKEGGAVAVPESKEDAGRAAEGWKDFEKKMNEFDLHGGIQQAFELVSALNMGFDKAAPWKLKGEERLIMLSRFAESLRHVALLLLPFLPETAQKISTQLNVSYASKMLDRDFVITDELKMWGSEKSWKQVGDPSILFAPVETEAKKA
jgi:methionyl-tRNA synthetase